MAINFYVNVTFTASSETTAVSDDRISANSILILMPLTESAGLSEYYISAQSAGSCTITHVNNAETDRDFRMLILA